MPIFCAVVNCGSRGARDNVRFFRFPAVLNFKHKHRLNELSRLRRTKWIEAIKRSDLTEKKIKFGRVCSKHFLSGEPAKLENDLHPDWVPSVSMGWSRGASACPSLSKVSRFDRATKRSEPNVSTFETQTVNLEVENCEVENLGVENLEEIFVGPKVNDNDKEVQTDLNMIDINLLYVNETTLSNELKIFKSRSLCCENLENDNSKTKYYTGLSNYKVFEILVKSIKPFINTIHRKDSLEPKDRILLTLIKLRLNLDFKDIGFRFGISPSSTSTYFKDVVRVMYLRLKSLIMWPERSVLQKNIPQCFKEAFQEKTTVTIDCFEIRCETPSNLLLAAQAWSNYKHSETIKYLIGITPQGSVSFVSEGWGGRVSDKCLTQNSKFLHNLCPGDVVLADRGFLIKEFVELFRANVRIPAFTKGKSQLHPVDLENTRGIARVRIHVERVIGLLRSKYRILNGPVPITLLCTRGEEALLDEIVTVCCSLVNLCPSIVPL